MKITPNHLLFWQAKRGQPQWASKIEKLPTMPSVHTLINSQTPRDRPLNEPANTLAVLRLARKRGALREVLLQCCSSTDTTRAKFAAKWLERLNRRTQEMVAIITDAYGEVLEIYPLRDADILDCDIYAERYCRETGQMLDDRDGLVVFEGDFTVILTDQPGGVRCFKSQSYCFKGEDE